MTSMRTTLKVVYHSFAFIGIVTVAIVFVVASRSLMSSAKAINLSGMTRVYGASDADVLELAMRSRVNFGSRASGGGCIRSPVFLNLDETIKLKLPPGPAGSALVWTHNLQSSKGVVEASTPWEKSLYLFRISSKPESGLWVCWVPDEALAGVDFMDAP